MTNHEAYMQRCLQLASLGIGSTRPNPSVGCVIVHDDRIIGEGFTSPYGGAHAEVNAIDSVSDRSLLKAASLYVTLEPCSHHGKTPPCADLIIEYGIPKVYIGTVDTSSKVSGKGIDRLKASGCDVEIGILNEACKAHHKRFLTYHTKERPYIILKWAESTDGLIAPLSKDEKKPVWLTNQYSRQLVHKWRTEEHAILVGTTTVIKDDPSLTARDWKGNNPIRIVIDRSNKLSDTYQVFNADADTIIISDKNIDFDTPIAQQICSLLFEQQVQSMIVEGGTKTIQTFIDADLWDEARVFTGSVSLRDGLKAPKLSGEPISETHIRDDRLSYYLNKKR